MSTLITLAEMALVTLLVFSFALLIGLLSLAGLFHLAFARFRTRAPEGGGRI
ncbi:MAG TPA: hypothetical protein VKU44_07910 [Terriglobia bacterium]|nr:hypothetical protein [Terriglobia bacterium]